MPGGPVSTQGVMFLSSDRDLFMVTEWELAPATGARWLKLGVMEAAQSLSDAPTSLNRSEQAVGFMRYAVCAPTRLGNAASDALSLPAL